MPFVVQINLPLLAPALMAASIYMILARIIFAVGREGLCLLPIRMITTVFVIGDVLSFVVQTPGMCFLRGHQDRW